MKLKNRPNSLLFDQISHLALIYIEGYKLAICAAYYKYDNQVSMHFHCFLEEIR